MDLKSLSIKTKLISITFLVVAVCATCITFLTLYQHQLLYKENLSRNLDALSSNLSDELFPHLALNEPELINIATTIMKLDRYQHIKYGVVVTSEYKLLAQYLNPKFTVSEADLAQTDWRKMINGDIFPARSELLQSKAIGGDEYKIGTLVLVADVDEQLALDNTAMINQLFPLVLFITVILFVLSHWMQSGFINPLLKLSELVSRVSETKNYQLKYRVDGEDEVARLGNNINNMLQTIDKQDIENKRHTTKLLKQQQSLKHLANYDQLTGLPNRKFFAELLKQSLLQAKRSNLTIAVMFLDLDDFKTVNDSLGHHAGDALLKLVCERIQSHLREQDILARLGGDEFTVILADLPSEVTAVAIAERILKSFEKYFYIQEWEIQSGLSIGIAFNEEHKLDAQALISNADVAMYRAKESGRGQYAVFEETMQNVQHRHMLIANELAKAIQHNEFKLFYQPKVSPTHGVVGLEALIRWESQFDSWISPAEFIPVAEHCGKVHDITRWVIKQGFADLEYIKQTLGLNLVTSFNVSAIDITKKAFIDYIQQTIKTNSNDTSLIEFEVTETSYIENFEASSDFFKAMHELGCSIALDDFGTGYSSLSYLTQVKANTLKIDQQFISKIFTSEDDRLIVESIISLAKKLNLKICAEGVETKQQYDFIAAHECELIQGYYFSKPVPLDELKVTVDMINHSHRFCECEQSIVHFAKKR